LSIVSIKLFRVALGLDVSGGSSGYLSISAAVTGPSIIKKTAQLNMINVNHKDRERALLITEPPLDPDPYHALSDKSILSATKLSDLHCPLSTQDLFCWLSSLSKR